MKIKKKIPFIEMISSASLNKINNNKKKEKK